MQTIKLRTFIILSVAFHVVVISAIVLYFLKDSPSGGKSGTVMVGIISGHDNEQGKTSASKTSAEAQSTPQELSEPKVALQKEPAKNTVKRNTTNESQKETVKTIKKETKSTQNSKQVSTSQVAKEEKAGKGIESASIVKDGNFGSPDNQDTGIAGTNTELAYPDYNLNPKPNYPRTARKRGYEGEVKLKVFVLENGEVGEIVVVRASGYEILDQSALEAVKNWTFIPGKENGKEISSWVTVPITFQLKSG
jgi:TonB family protein